MVWRRRAPTVGSATRRWTSPRRSEPASALDTAVRFLAQRPRSEYEVRRRLRRAGVEDAAIDAVVAQLRQHQLLDDAAFAQYWAEQRQAFRPRGARLLRAELAHLGVEPTAAREAALATTASASDDAYRAALKYVRHLNVADERGFKARVSQWLARRGFDWETVAEVVDRLVAERVSTS